MTQRNLLHSYRRVATQTASPGQLVLMLYDGAIRFLEQALRGFDSDDPLDFNQTISNNLLRAQAIIAELNVSLNLEEGGELSSTLHSLYNYMDRRLQESNLRKTPEGIHDVIDRLSSLRDAWAEMLQNGAPSTAIPGHSMVGGTLACAPA